MRRISLCCLSITLSFISFAQKQVQSLPPARLGVFKNGTCFVKREGQVKVTEKSFFINAPTKVLMGTYWLFVGKESSLHSIVMKADTFKVRNQPKFLSEYIEANIGQNVVLYSGSQNPDMKKVSGKIIGFDKESWLTRIETANGKMIVVDSRNFESVEVAGGFKGMVTSDSIISVAKVKLNKEVENTFASTISLEKGVQWFPSYLFTIINDKEAKLELKATIANGETEYRNMPVDIIIGNPEMFYQKMLDPVCIDYLKESLDEGRYDNNSYGFNALTANAVSVLNYSTQTSGREMGDANAYQWSEDGVNDKKLGQKLEDLYYYQLGIVDLEKNSRVIVPVMSTQVTYSEVYTADLPLQSTSMEGTNSIQVYHAYLISNNTTAPFTTGAALVLNKEGQPLAQAQMLYTPVKGRSEMQLSKAVDVQVKNEEEETGREKSSTKKNFSSNYEKVNHRGTVSITNYKDKKITIRVAKKIEGIFVKTDNNGKSRKVRTGDDDSDIVSEIYWEIEVEAGARLQLTYEYYSLD